jgi:hypothetical protein
MSIFSRIKAKLAKRKKRKALIKKLRRHGSYFEYQLRARQWKNEMIREAMKEGVLIYGWSHDPQFGESKSNHDLVFNHRRKVVKSLKKMSAEGCAQYLRKWSSQLQSGKAPSYLEVI